MDLLQKLTLYDLLGYTLPGTVLLLVYSQENNTLKMLQTKIGTNEKNIGYIIIFLLFGYLTGIIISEITTILQRLINILAKKYILRKKEKAFETCNIDETRLSNALQNARIIERSSGITVIELYQKYASRIYADIQSDKKYIRLHNYASAELLYKNMTFVSLLCSIYFLTTCQQESTIIAIISTLCFYHRWQRFGHKKSEYCLYWFLKKYSFPKQNSNNN